MAAHSFGCATALLLGTLATPSRAQPTAPTAWVAFEHAWAKVSAYSTRVTTFERKGTQVQNWVLDYTFRKKPLSATVHFIKGEDAGATLVWRGGKTVVGHRAGIIAAFKRMYSLHDPKVMTIHGSSIDELSFASILAHSIGTPGAISQGSGPTILGIRTKAVTLIPISSGADTDLTREVIDISALNSLPMRALGYQGNTLVRQVDFANIRLQR